MSRLHPAQVGLALALLSTAACRTGDVDAGRRPATDSTAQPAETGGTTRSADTTSTGSAQGEPTRTSTDRENSSTGPESEPTSTSTGPEGSPTGPLMDLG